MGVMSGYRGIGQPRVRHGDIQTTSATEVYRRGSMRRKESSASADSPDRAGRAGVSGSSYALFPKPGADSSDDFHTIEFVGRADHWRRTPNLFGISAVMISPLFRFCGLCGFILLLSSPASSQAPAKRALTHADYAAWRAIQSPILSADGSVVAYSVTPQEGDGEFVLRQVASGKEFRHSIGSRLVVTPPAKAAPGPAAPRFSPDGKHVLFSILLSQADRTKSKEASRSDLGIMDVTTGQVVRLERVQRFMVPKDGGIAVVAYLRGVAPAPADPTKGTHPIGPAQKTPAIVPSELVLRNLTDGKERTFAHVTEFSLTRDGRWLVWAANDKKQEDNGVFAVPTTTGASVVTVQRGPGKFSRLTWDEKQTQMVFFRGPLPPTTPAVVAPPPRIAHWRPSAAPASVLSIPMPATLLAGLTLVAAQATTPRAIDLTPAKVDLGPGSVIREQGLAVCRPR